MQISSNREVIEQSFELLAFVTAVSPTRETAEVEAGSDNSDARARFSRAGRNVVLVAQAVLPE
jgi:hypothetical protein